jgi:hypothetical protein
MHMRNDRHPQGLRRVCRRLTVSAALLCALSPWGAALQAQSLFLDKDTGEVREPERLVLPYLFSSDDLGLTLGLAVSASAAPQPQAYSFATGYASDNGSWLLSFLGKDWLVPGTERFFVNPLILFSEWAQLRVYSGSNPEFPDEIPGSNDSSEDNYFQERAYDVWAYMDCAYVLPIGDAKDQAIFRYTMDRGLPVKGAVGGRSINPFKSGRTRLVLRPEYRRQFIHLKGFEEETGRKPIAETLNCQLTLDVDNRDFPPNPTHGYRTQFRVMYDPAVLADTPDEWVVLDAELAIYIPLPAPPSIRQSTLAFDIWTADTPTWDEEGSGIRYEVNGAPPYYSGATLGGLFRMKAYPNGRFNGRSAIYYGAEYRFMPDWQPLPDIRWLGLFDIQWWQVVVLGELGRTAYEYDLKELHTDMKWDAGVAVNVMFGTGVGRLNVTVGEEGSQVLVMMGQTY